ncbi:MAG TPA: hypothetical protein VJL32_01425 [Candidatus Paceibacterota bacterium]
MTPGLINPNRNLQPRQDQATNDNLIKPISSERVVRPPGFWSGLIVDLVVMLLACGFGYLYYRYLLSGGYFLLYSILAGSALLLVSLFDTLLTKSFTRRVVVVLAEVVVMSLWFMASGIMSFVLAVAGAAAFFMLWGELQSRREMENGLEIQFFKIARPQLNKGITALVLFGVLSYLPLYSYERIFMPESVFSSVYGWAANIVKGMYPELELNGDFNKFIGSITDLKVKSDYEFAGLPDNAQKMILQELNAQTVKAIKDRINIDFSETQPMYQIFYNYLKNMVQNWESKFGEKFLAAWAMVVFFVVRSFGFVLYIILSVLGFFVYQLLLAMNFIRIVGESRVHETMEYS